MKLLFMLVVLISMAASVAAYPDPTPSADIQRKSIQTAISLIMTNKLETRYDTNRAFYIYQMVQKTYYYQIIGFPIKGSKPSKREDGSFTIRLYCLVFIDIHSQYYLHELTEDDYAAVTISDEFGKPTRGSGHIGLSEPRPPLKLAPKRLPNSTTNQASEAIAPQGGAQPQR